PNTSVSNSVFHQVALTIDDSAGGKLYLDGAQIATLSTFAPAYTAISFQVGDGYGFATYQGVLSLAAVDEVRVSTIAYSATQILSDFQNGNPYYGQYSTDGGATFATVVSTVSGTAPFVSVTGTNGTTTPQTMKLSRLALPQSADVGTGSNADNQLFF